MSSVPTTGIDFGIGAVVATLLNRGIDWWIGRNKPKSDQQIGEAAQIQALIASATYFEGQAKRFKDEAQMWQKEASDWHERFYRGMVDIKVLGQSTQTVHDLTKQQSQQGAP